VPLKKLVDLSVTRGDRNSVCRCTGIEYRPDGIGRAEDVRPVGIHASLDGKLQRNAALAISGVDIRAAGDQFLYNAGPRAPGGDM